MPRNKSAIVPIGAHGLRAAYQSGLVGGQGGAKDEGGESGAPKRAREHPPPGLGAHVEPPNSEDWRTGRGAGLPHATMGGKHEPKMRLLRLNGAEGDGACCLQRPKAGPDSWAPAACPLKPPPCKGEVRGACYVAASARGKYAHKGVKPGGPRSPEGADSPDWPTRGAVGAAAADGKAMQRGGSSPGPSVGGCRKAKGR